MSITTSAEIVNVAKRLFEQTGFHKTTVADIAHELNMSSANVYRFFASKAKLNEAVCRLILEEIEQTAEQVSRRPCAANKMLRDVILAISELNAQRARSEPKLHHLFETAYEENWPVLAEHFEWMDGLFEQIIKRGIASGELNASDPKLAAVILRSIATKFCYARLIAPESEPEFDQIVGFCLAALTAKNRAGASGRMLVAV